MAERLALKNAFGEVRLFVGAEEWRLLAPSARKLIQLPSENGRGRQVERMVDLPDGTFLAYAERASATWDSSPCVVRMRESELCKDLRGSRETASQIAVVGYSLGEVLDGAPLSNGDLNLPVLARLSDPLCGSRCAGTGLTFVGHDRLELSANGLRVRCSTN